MAAMGIWLIAPSNSGSITETSTSDGPSPLEWCSHSSAVVRVSRIGDR